jgi:hypothetical protein
VFGKLYHMNKVGNIPILLIQCFVYVDELVMHQTNETSDYVKKYKLVLTYYTFFLYCVIQSFCRKHDAHLILLETKEKNAYLQRIFIKIKQVNMIKCLIRFIDIMLFLSSLCNSFTLDFKSLYIWKKCNVTQQRNPFFKYYAT